VAGFIGIVLVIMVGHTQAQHMVKTQPMKMAAAEGLFESEDPASFSLITIGDWEQREEMFAIRIPKALSLLSYNRLDGEVKGINDLQAEYEQQYGPDENYIPPVAITYWSFRAMVGAGFLMLGLAGLAIVKVLRETLGSQPRFLYALVLAIALPYIANSAGWIMTEIGRQPWIVFGLQRTEDAVSPNVSAEMVALSLVIFTLIYGVFMAADVYLLVKYGKKGPVEAEDESDGPEPTLVAA
jgi:cytochrome d ubiquinol oxidase subunit I